eukprot:scaffold7633_cov68-Cylindrotheca_fusiformis.AAC.2
MLATSYPQCLFSNKAESFKKQGNNIFCTFVRSQQQDDEAAQEFIMMFREPCKSSFVAAGAGWKKRSSCTSLSGNV